MLLVIQGLLFGKQHTVQAGTIMSPESRHIGYAAVLPPVHSSASLSALSVVQDLPQSAVKADHESERCFTVK